MTGVFMVSWDEVDERGVCSAEDNYTTVTSICRHISISHVGEQHLSRSTETMCSGQYEWCIPFKNNLYCYFKHLYCWRWLIIITLCVYVSATGLRIWSASVCVCATDIHHVKKNQPQHV